jgi:3-methyladenine DNA glycosylase/8-oxoguanine DNA glycosylase
MLLCLALAEIAIPFAHASSSDSTIVRSVLTEDLRDEDRVSSQGERGRVLSCASRSSQEVLELAKAKTAKAVKVSEQLVSVLEKIVDETPDLEQLIKDVAPDMERLNDLPLRTPLGWNLWGFLAGRLVAEVCVSRAAQG